ncbi:carbohydrate kinase family protein [Patescibacteria group bacterium]
MKKRDVISVGSALRDVMYYTSDTDVIKNPKNDPIRLKLMCVEYGAKLQSDKVYFAFGGGGANTSINFAGLGLKTGVLASIGYDLDGRGIKEHLEFSGVDTGLLRITQDHRTGFSFLVVDEKSGEHTAFVYYGSARDLSVPKSALQQNPADWYYVSSIYSRKWREVMERLGDTKSSRIAWNPGSRQLKAGYRGLKRFVSQTSVLILNKDEATELTLSQPKTKRAGSTKQMLQQLHSWGPEIVVITNSRKGAFAYDGKEHYYMKSPNDKPKDTTGAGDCYGSSFVAGIIRYNGDIKKAMKLAQVNATALVHSIGAQNGFLKWKDLPKNLKKRPAKRKR